MHEVTTKVKGVSERRKTTACAFRYALHAFQTVNFHEQIADGHEMNKNKSHDDGFECMKCGSKARMQSGESENQIESTW